MTGLIPHPVLSLVLTILWLLLTRFSLGHLLLGAGIGMLAGWSFARIEPTGPRIRHLAPLIRLAGIVGVDILRSNLAVARLIVTDGRSARRRSGFVEVQLRLQDPAPLALLAIVIAATPGTAWLKHDPATGRLLLHVFDMKDPAEWQALIADRYESLLLRAFG